MKQMQQSYEEKLAAARSKVSLEMVKSLLGTIDTLWLLGNEDGRLRRLESIREGQKDSSP